MIAALPMYYPPIEAVEQFWAAVAADLQPMVDFAVPAALTWPTDYPGHWVAPDLLLSQTCGYPLTHALQGRVQLVGTFAYGVVGADGIHCRSQLICRATDVRQRLADFAGSTLAFNSTDSQSGYNALREQVARETPQRPFFRHSIATDAHRQSIECVRQGLADMASIDAVTWALWCEAQPERAAELRVFGQTEAYPGLPLVTSLQTSPQVLQALRQTLSRAATDPAFAALRAPLRITGFAVTTLQDYARCLQMEANALDAGLQAL